MKRATRRRSSVWDCFEQEGKVVRCMKCDATLKYCGGATSTMMSHMSRHHASTAPLDEDEKPVICRVQSLEEESTANSEIMQVAIMSPNINIMNANPTERDCGVKRRPKRSSVWDIFVRVDDEVHCTMCDTKLKYRSSTTNMMYHIKNNHQGTASPTRGINKGSSSSMPNDGVSVAAHTEVTELISRMIEKDMLPISLLRGDGFRELLAYTVHTYKMPSAEDIVRLIEGHFREKAEELRVQLGKVEKVSLTADFWTALPFQRYVTVSCSFITEDWQGRSVVLQTHKLSSDSHTSADSVTERLFNTVETWGIDGKVTACVHNDTQGILFTHECPPVTWDYATCFATTLQLAVSVGLSEDLVRIIVSAGKLVKHFNHNLQACEALEQKQVHMCLPQHKLIQSSKARWDTICDMFERLLEQRWPIKAVLSDRTITNRQEAQMLEIEDDCWQIIENFTPVLATLKWATTVISAETEVSISNIYPITFSLIQTHLVPKENDVEQVSEFKLKVQKLLQNHMEVDSNGLASKPALIAAMLDPRHKHLSFLTPTGRLSAKVKLHELVAKLDVMTTTVGLKDEHQEILVTPDISQEAAMPSQLRSDTKNTMMLLLGDNYSSSYATDSEAQVDYYLRDIAPSLDINPLDWWKVNGPRFPKLATLARHYLCVPGVSLPSLLSESGQTFAKMRTRLAPEHVDMMIFVNRNA
ncbi:zinc finger BED domain-containing protein 1-like [Gymnodraco acuticeps]|uniref:Zinc finger BED domain-containing protein 1-like n=1 Tax=Gymnodraco acuticeps TaxID=8218 RepID=A0A6P8WAS1_GYMAC|nr:zinc finger BED domain-containing protein 1-like [Gymnodraco acuticeps]